MKLTDITEGASDSLKSAGAFAGDIIHPKIRLGVTGLSRSGKTVFITSLIHNLLNGGRLPFFEPWAQGRIRQVYLEPQPNDALPRFDYETHLDALNSDPPKWPESTRRISQLRLTIEYDSTIIYKRTLGHSKLSIDILDYPGEWLLDLPLLNKSYETWSFETLANARSKLRMPLAEEWLQSTKTCDPQDTQNEQLAMQASELFKNYLTICRDDEFALSSIPPGRFLIPGDWEGSPALTFAPLNLPQNQLPKANSLWSMMARRFEAYKSHIAKPFFRDHFVQLDRQIVLVDALQALNGGPNSVRDLEHSLTEILDCFRTGRHSWLSQLWSKKIEKILFAATKADHLHHSSHGRLEAALDQLMERVLQRAKLKGTDVKSLVLSAVRSTSEATAEEFDPPKHCVIGVPIDGERIGGKIFDGTEKIAVFPGDLPGNPGEALNKGFSRPAPDEEKFRFVHFSPPKRSGNGRETIPPLPHIRLDRALQYLLGDRLK